MAILDPGAAKTEIFQHHRQLQGGQLVGLMATYSAMPQAHGDLVVVRPKMMNIAKE